MIKKKNQTNKHIPYRRRSLLQLRTGSVSCDRAWGSSALAQGNDCSIQASSRGGEHNLIAN